MPLWLLGIDAGLSHTQLGLAPLVGPLLGLGGAALLILSAATGEFSSLHLGQVSTRS